MSTLVNILFPSKKLCKKILTRSPKRVLKSELYKKNAETKGYPYRFSSHADITFLWVCLKMGSADRSKTFHSSLCGCRNTKSNGVPPKAPLQLRVNLCLLDKLNEGILD